jgi:serine acetyltransferase
MPRKDSATQGVFGTAVRYRIMMRLKQFVSQVRADFTVNARWDSRVTIFVFRLNQWVKIPPLRQLARLLHVLWIEILMGAQIPPEASIGCPLYIPHGGRGVIIHPNSRIGDGVTLYHRVTIGVRNTADRAPTLQDGVFVGAGASIIGSVTVGVGAQVGAGAVVVRDVGGNETVVGIPATSPPEDPSPGNLG